MFNLIRPLPLKQKPAHSAWKHSAPFSETKTGCVLQKNIALIIICQGNRSQVFFQQLVSTILHNLQCPYPSISSFFFWVLCSFVSTKKHTKQSAYLTPWKFLTTSPLKNYSKTQNFRKARSSSVFLSTMAFREIQLAVKNFGEYRVPNRCTYKIPMTLLLLERQGEAPFSPNIHSCWWFRNPKANHRLVI